MSSKLALLSYLKLPQATSSYLKLPGACSFCSRICVFVM